MDYWNEQYLDAVALEIEQRNGSMTPYMADTISAARAGSHGAMREVVRTLCNLRGAQWTYRSDVGMTVTDPVTCTKCHQPIAGPAMGSSQGYRHVGCVPERQLEGTWVGDRSAAQWITENIAPLGVDLSDALHEAMAAVGMEPEDLIAASGLTGDQLRRIADGQWDQVTVAELTACGEALGIDPMALHAGSPRAGDARLDF